VAAPCAGCRELPPPWEALSAAFLYLPPLTGVVRALKFRGGEFLGPPLGEALAARCAPRDAELVTAVPLPWPRLLARGYNQAEVVARALAATLGLPHRRLLRRRARRRQTGLGRQDRVRNVTGAFHARRGEPIRGARVLLVDDVMTTGATLEAAARALREAGASAVSAAVVARTPRAGWGDPGAVPSGPWSGAR
jgi:ComF family protein